MNKGKALLSTALNIKHLAKIPPFIKTAIEEFKGELSELKEAVDELKNNMPKVQEGGKKCSSKRIVDPVKCYNAINGRIKYTES